MKLTKRFNHGALLASLLLASVVGCAAEPEKKSRLSAETIKAGRALFDERCKTVAGEKIYRTIEDVEGIVLLKVRPKRSDADLSSRDWPGAAFAREWTEKGYIQTFLWYENASLLNGVPLPISPDRRGYLNTTPSNLPGYGYVDVADEKTGEVWRYSGSERVVPTVSSPLVGGDGKTHMVKRYVLDRNPAPKDRPRYGVTYEDHVISEERALGLASSTVKVLDIKTQEVLGEMTMYAWTPGVLNMGPRGSASAVPWLSAYTCGNLSNTAGTKTRLFVDRVLKPGKGT